MPADTAENITPIAVISSPTTSNASLYYAQSSGIFEENGLEMAPELAQSGAQAIPLLLNGQVQFTASDPLAAIVAISQGTPVTIVVGGNVVPEASADASGTFVPAGSPIETLADLEGRTVGVNALRSFSQIALLGAIDENGGDSSDVEWVEVGFAQMTEVVERGTVDSATTTEPFITQAKAAGMRLLPNGGLSTTMLGVPQMVYLATNEYVASNPAIVDAFAASINEANEVLSGDQDLIREVAATSTTVPPELLEQIILPTFGPRLSLESMERLQDQMVKYGILEAPIDLSEHIRIVG